MGDRVLTVRDRIIVHLSGYNRFADEFECPEDMCQSGISVATGKSRAHITLELNRMKDAGLIYERNARIKGGKSKRKTYLLTPSGIARNSEINGMLDALKVELISGDGNTTVSGTQAAEQLKSQLNMPRVAAVDTVLDSMGMIEMMKLGRFEKRNDWISFMPLKQEGLLPRREMGKITEAVESLAPNTIMLLGIPGIGKSALISELAWSLDKWQVMYRKVYQHDSQRSVLATIGDFLNIRGEPGLKKYLSQSQNFDLMEAGSHIANHLAKAKTLMVFDEFERAPPSLNPLLSMLMEHMNGTASRMLLASSKRGDFYTTRDVTVDKRVMEITLGPMDPDSSARILSATGDKRQKEMILVGGHPLTLKLMATGMRPSSLGGFVEDEILGKDTDLAKLCRFAAVLRRPFSPDDIELFGFEKAPEIKRNLAFEWQPGGGFLLHPAISTILLESTGKRMLREMHSQAAEFYMKSGSEPHEVMHHLVQANRIQDARQFAIESRNGLLESNNMDELAGIMELLLWGGCESVDLKDLASDIMDRAGHWDRATNLAGQVAKCSHGTRVESEALLRKARIQGKTGDLEGALKTLNGAKKGVEGTELEPALHLAKAAMLRKLGRNKDSLKESEMVMAQADGYGDPALSARGRMERAMALSASGEHKRALKELELAKKRFEKESDAADTIRCEINLGMVQRALERLDDSIASLERAVAMSEKHGFNRFRAHALANMADILNQQKDYSKSLAIAREAQEVFDRLGEPLMQAVAMLNQCGAHAGLGEKEKAMTVMDDAIALLKSKNLLDTKGGWLVECADIMKGLGEKKKAAELLAMGRSLNR